MFSIFSKPAQKTPFEQLELKDIKSKIKVIRKKTAYFKNLKPEIDSTEYEKLIVLQQLLRDLDKVIEDFNSHWKIFDSKLLTVLLLIDFLLIIERIGRNQKRCLGTHRSLSKQILYLDIGPVKDISLEIEIILVDALSHTSEFTLAERDYPDTAKIIIDFTKTIANVLRDILQPYRTLLPYIEITGFKLTELSSILLKADSDIETYGFHTDGSSLTFYWEDQEKEIKTVLLDKCLSSDELMNLAKTKKISALHILAIYKAILHEVIGPKAVQCMASEKEEDLSAYETERP